MMPAGILGVKVLLVSLSGGLASFLSLLVGMVCSSPLQDMDKVNACIGCNVLDRLADSLRQP